MDIEDSTIRAKSEFQLIASIDWGIGVGSGILPTSRDIDCERQIHERHALPAPATPRPLQKNVRKAINEKGHALSLQAYGSNGVGPS